MSVPFYEAEPKRLLGVWSTLRVPGGRRVTVVNVRYVRGEGNFVLYARVDWKDIRKMGSFLDYGQSLWMKFPDPLYCMDLQEARVLDRKETQQFNVIFEGRVYRKNPDGVPSIQEYDRVLVPGVEG